jgi:hypothetical protein
MMADQPASKGPAKTLLKIEGDASGAVRAARESQAAIEATRRASEEANRAAAQSPAAIEATRRASEEANRAAAQSPAAGPDPERTRDAAAATEELAQSQFDANTNATVLSGVMDLLNARMGTITRTITRLRRGLRYLFTPLGAGIAAAAAGLALLIGYFERVTRAAEQFAAAQERIKRASLELEDALSREMARLGQVSEAALGKATAVARRKEEEGFEGAAVRAVVPAVVTEAGGLAIPEDELDRLIAAAQLGDVSLGGATPRERERALQRARRTVEKQRDQYTRAVRMLRSPTRHREERAAAGDPGELRRILEEEGLQGDDLEQALEDLRNVAEGGDIEHRGGMFGLEGLGEAIMEGLGVTRRGAQARGRLEGIRRRARGLIPRTDPLSPEQRRFMAPIPAGGARSHMRAGEPTEFVADEFGLRPAGTAPPVVINNHGTINMGGPKLSPVRRAGG